MSGLPRGMPKRPIRAVGHQGEDVNRGRDFLFALDCLVARVGRSLAARLMVERLLEILETEPPASEELRELRLILRRAVDGHWL